MAAKPELGDKLCANEHPTFPQKISFIVISSKLSSSSSPGHGSNHGMNIRTASDRGGALIFLRM